MCTVQEVARFVSVLLGEDVDWFNGATIDFTGGMTLRLIHTAAAYWGLIIIAIHAGLHVRAPQNHSGNSCYSWFIIRKITVLIAAFGVWSFIERDMFSKLFLGFSFDYWDERRPAILFFAENLGIMAAVAALTYYAGKLLSRRNA
jgi:hypothetical protein